MYFNICIGSKNSIYKKHGILKLYVEVEVNFKTIVMYLLSCFQIYKKKNYKLDSNLS